MACVMTFVQLFWFSVPLHSILLALLRCCRKKWRIPPDAGIGVVWMHAFHQDLLLGDHCPFPLHRVLIKSCGTVNCYCRCLSLKGLQ
uniref:Uncharacterized protein n=1 Tax=Setaria viridis TaxID=4556 RepID=A0A4U6VEN6_SETVI|nr:hypothetical protein SEVIR_3G283950v2 [Setaria viridis]